MEDKFDRMLEWIVKCKWLFIAIIVLVFTFGGKTPAERIKNARIECEKSGLRLSTMIHTGMISLFDGESYTCATYVDENER